MAVILYVLLYPLKMKLHIFQNIWMGERETFGKEILLFGAMKMEIQSTLTHLQELIMGTPLDTPLMALIQMKVEFIDMMENPLS